MSAVNDQSMSMEDMLRKYLGIGGIHCMDVHQLLFEYVQGHLDSEMSAKLEQHLGDCESCGEFVKTYRRTIGACREQRKASPEIPPNVQKKLQDFIATNF